MNEDETDPLRALSGVVIAVVVILAAGVVILDATGILPRLFGGLVP